jgi:hypothetical protein
MLVTVIFANGAKGQEVPDMVLDAMVSEYAETYDASPPEEFVVWDSIEKYRLDPIKKSGSFSGKKLINLNQTSLDELRHIPVLTMDQCLQLEHYLKTYGEVFSFYELLAVNGFDSLLIDQLRSYVILGPVPNTAPLTPRNLIQRGRHDLILRYRESFPHTKGYESINNNDHGTFDSLGTNNGYLGNPQGYLVRYRYSYGEKVTIGLTGDKDPGEEFFKGSQHQGMDHYAAFIQIRNIRWLEQCILGTFRTSFGQGLTLGGLTFGSSVGFGTTHQFFSGFRPSQSATEYGYLQGLALTIRTGKWYWSGFFSYAKRDANLIETDSLGFGDPLFRSLVYSGYHRTQKELDKKGTIGEMIYGGNLRYLGRFFIVGLTGYYGKWNGVYEPDETLYKLYQLDNNHFGAIGINTRIRAGWAQFFGELTSDKKGTLAWLAGVTGIPVQGIDFLLSLRNYPKNFQNPLASAVSQGSNNQNESGFYARVNLGIIRGVNLSGFLDVYKNPWLQYRIDAPSTGIESGLLMLYQPFERVVFGMRYTYRSNTINSSLTTSGVNPIIAKNTHEFQFSMDIQPTLWLQLRSKFQTKVAQHQETGVARGYLLSQLIKFTNLRKTWVIQCQAALFDTPDYAARIYLYEPDILYGFSVPGYYGKGLRAVLTLKKKMGRHFTFWGWAGLWHYTDRTVIGTDNEAVDGSTKCEIKLQVRIRI